MPKHSSGHCPRHTCNTGLCRKPQRVQPSNSTTDQQQYNHQVVYWKHKFVDCLPRLWTDGKQPNNGGHDCRPAAMHTAQLVKLLLPLCDEHAALLSAANHPGAFKSCLSSACDGRSTWQVVLLDLCKTFLGKWLQVAVYKADLYDEVFVGDLAGVCMEQKLTCCQHSTSACCILSPM